VIGLPAVTLGLIALDQHASGALLRNRTNASTDPMLVCSQPQGHWACFCWMVWPETIPMPAKPACWEPSLWPTASLCTSCGSMVAGSGSASRGRDQASRPVCRGNGTNAGSDRFISSLWSEELGLARRRSALGVSYILPWGVKFWTGGKLLCDYCW
jgi:hypothetical protein